MTIRPEVFITNWVLQDPSRNSVKGEAAVHNQEKADPRYKKAVCVNNSDLHDTHFCCIAAFMPNHN